MSWGLVLAVVLLVVLLGGALISEARSAFGSSKRKTRKSMHNVAEATDADDFDADGLTLTVNEMGVGPAAE